MKKKTISRVISLALASVLCFSACGQGDEKVTSKESEQPASSSNVQESSSDVVEQEDLPYWELLDQVSDTSELPDWEGETLEVTIWYAAGTAGMESAAEVYKAETDVAYKELERVTGVKFNIEDSFDNGGNNIDAKLPMVVASGDYPTIIMGHDIVNQLTELYENGYLADLTDYYTNGDLDQITKWYPLEEGNRIVYSNVRSEAGDYFAIPQGGQAANTTSQTMNGIGHIPDVYDTEYFALYAANPTMATGRNGANAVMVRDDILKALKPDALTMDEIKKIWVERGTFTEEEVYSVNLNSAEEFYDFLYDINELLKSGEYVGLDGKAMEVTYGPHAETDNYYLMSWMPALIDGVNAEYFSYANLAAKDESDVIKMAYDSDYFVDLMKDINKLVRDDVISQNSMIDNLANFDEKLKNLHYAVTYGENMQNVLADVDTEIGYTPIWINTPYNTEIGGVKALKFNNYYGIFKDALSDEELDQLIHAINYINSVVGTNNFIWGPETAGLFTEDADGNREYTDDALYNCMVLNEDNAASRTYGLINMSTKQNGFCVRPRSIVECMLQPSYLAASTMDRLESRALFMYCPGALAGKSLNENALFVNVGAEIYSALSNEIQGLKDFWSARNGYESQVKKVLVAASDAEFETQLENLKVFARENGITDEVLKEFNDLWVDRNRDALQSAGIID